MTQEEQEYLRKLMIFLYGDQASVWTLNDKLLEVAGEILAGSKKCSVAMDFVPRPGFVDKDYLKRQLVGIVKRILRQKKHYESCLAVAKRNFATSAHEAGMSY